MLVSCSTRCPLAALLSASESVGAIETGAREIGASASVGARAQTSLGRRRRQATIAATATDTAHIGHSCAVVTVQGSPAGADLVTLTDYFKSGALSVYLWSEGGQRLRGSDLNCVFSLSHGALLPLSR
jgi:hypothetical protein